MNSLTYEYFSEDINSFLDQSPRNSVYKDIHGITSIVYEKVLGENGVLFKFSVVVDTLNAAFSIVAEVLKEFMASLGIFKGKVENMFKSYDLENIESIDVEFSGDDSHVYYGSSVEDGKTKIVAEEHVKDNKPGKVISQNYIKSIEKDKAQVKSKQTDRQK